MRGHKSYRGQSQRKYALSANNEKLRKVQKHTGSVGVTGSNPVCSTNQTSVQMCAEVFFVAANAAI